METEQRALEIERELALAHDALQDWRSVTSEMSSSSTDDEDSWRWVQAAEEQARSRQEAVLRSLINFMHVKQEQIQHNRGRRGSSDGSTSTSSPKQMMAAGRRKSIAPEDMMGRGSGYRKQFPDAQKDLKERKKDKEVEQVDSEDDTMSEEEEKRNEAKLRQVELLVRRMSVHLEETVNVSAPRVKPTAQDVKTSSRMVPLRR
jgi:hypothetical protein